MLPRELKWFLTPLDFYITVPSVARWGGERWWGNSREMLQCKPDAFKLAEALELSKMIHVLIRKLGTQS